MSTLSDRLRTARKIAGKKQKEVADHLKIPATTYANYEQDKSEPSLSRLQEISSFLDTTPEYLLGRSDDPSPRPEDAVIVRGDYVGPLSPEEKAWLESVLDAYRARKE